MTIEMNTRTGHLTEYAQTLTREQRAEARKKLAAQFADLLERSPAENIYWMETVTDLMDLSHEVYLTESMLDADGRPFGFMRIVKRACAVLHVPLPANPYSMAFNARNRKGVRQTSMFSRYCWQMYSKGKANPLDGMIQRMGEMNNGKLKIKN